MLLGELVHTMMQEEARSVWEGRIADTALRVEVQPSGRIVALWRAKGGGDRRVVVNTIEELERSVLFQLMLTAPPDQAGIPAQIAEAVDQARVGLPDPTSIPRAPRKKRPSRRPGSHRPRRRR
jgi:hypothetical protein